MVDLQAGECSSRADQGRKQNKLNTMVHTLYYVCPADLLQKKFVTKPWLRRNEPMNGDGHGTADLMADVAAWQRARDQAAARRLPRRAAEEDLAQEVFVRFFERRKELLKLEKRR